MGATDECWCVQGLNAEKAIFSLAVQTAHREKGGQWQQRLGLENFPYIVQFVAVGHTSTPQRTAEVARLICSDLSCRLLDALELVGRLKRMQLCNHAIWRTGPS